VAPLSVLRARAIGALPMVDDAGEDEKIIAVCCDDPGFAHYTTLADLPSHQQRQIDRFFQDYKILERKAVRTMEFMDRDEALTVIQDSVDRYARTYPERSAS
jgi:inorganic pyrophosphatase